MVIREGQFGKFWACPKSYEGNNHGTKKWVDPARRKYGIRFLDDDPHWGVDQWAINPGKD